MWRGAPLSEDEAARRKASAARAWTLRDSTPLYRVSTMSPDAVVQGTFGASSPVQTRFVFVGGEGDPPRPRLEVHTVERGTVSAAAPVLWLADFAVAAPAATPRADALDVTVSGSPVGGRLLAATTTGWMVSVDAPDAAVVVLGPGRTPETLALIPVDSRALTRAERHVSGLDGA